MTWSNSFKEANPMLDPSDAVRKARMSGGRKTRRGGCGCKGGSRRRKSRRRYR